MDDSQGQRFIDENPEGNRGSLWTVELLMMTIKSQNTDAQTGLKLSHFGFNSIISLVLQFR